MQRLGELNLSHHTVSSIPSAVTAASLAQTKSVNHDGIPSFQNLDVSYASIGDVRVDTRGAMPPWTCAAATGDCLKRKM